jgi:hypothetical protein
MTVSPFGPSPPSYSPPSILPVRKGNQGKSREIFDFSVLNGTVEFGVDSYQDIAWFATFENLLIHGGTLEGGDSLAIVHGLIDSSEYPLLFLFNPPSSYLLFVFDLK